MELNRKDLVSDEKLRFDFSYERKLSTDQISEIEDLVNEQIENEIATQTRVMSYEDALETGALAFLAINMAIMSEF